MPTFTPDNDLISTPSEYNGYIDKTGSYIGRFVQVWDVASPKGTIGINFNFVSDDGARAPTFTIWTHNQNGRPIEILSKYSDKPFYPGLSFVNDILAIKQIKTAVKPVNGVIDVYDFDLRQNVTKPAQIYPDLLGNIGVILTSEEYNGKKYLRLNKVFDAQTRRTAYEVAHNKFVNGLQKHLDYLDKHGWHKVEKQEEPKNPHAENTDTNTHQANNDFDDDLPF